MYAKMDLEELKQCNIKNKVDKGLKISKKFFQCYENEMKYNTKTWNTMQYKNDQENPKMNIN